jgi:hypothetical protein
VVRRLLLAVAACVLIAAPLAHARDRWSGSGPRMQSQGQPVKKVPGQGQHPRGDRGKQGGHEKGNQNRLSEEQRRELNRDLDRANREIYRR